MSRFLAHLVARAAQRGPLLERRRPALFEPRAARRDAPPGIDDAPAAHGSEFAVARARAAARGGDPAPVDTDAPPHLREPAAQPTAAPTALGKSALRDPAPAPAPPASPVRRDDDAADHAYRPLPTEMLVRAGIETRRAEPGAASLPGLALARSANAPAVADVDPVRPARAQPALLPDVRRASATDTMAAPVLAPARDVPRDASPGIEQAVRLAQAAAPRLEATHAAPADQTVQITIGRVEVRAVGGAERATARQARTAPARLSLDEYLRTRNGGAR